MKKPLHNLKTLIASIFLLLAFGLSGWGQTSFTATYNLSGSGNDVTSFSYNGTNYDGINPGNLIKVGITSTSNMNNFRGSNWPLGATEGSNVFSGTIDLTKYIGFTIGPVAGYKFTITSITFGVGRSATGPRQWEWRGNHDTFSSSLNNYTTLNSGLTNTGGVLTNPDLNSSWTGNVLSPAGYVDKESSVEFRLYGYNSETTAGTGGLQGNITITGTFSPSSPDTDPPVASFVPLDGATNVLVNINPVITFDEVIYTTAGIAVDNTNVAVLITFKKTDATGDNVAFSATIAGGKVITVVPAAELDNEQLYYLAVAPVKDAVGNESEIQKITFTTVGTPTPTLVLTGSYPGPYYAGDDLTVTWDAANINFVLVQAWVPHLASWLTSGPPQNAAAGTYTFPIPSDAPYSAQYKIRVKNAEDDTPVDESDPITVRAVATTLAAVRAYAVNDEFRYDGTAIVSATDGFNNRKFIQDATAAVLIFDAGGVITNTYNVGDGMTGIIGRKTIASDMMRLVPLANPGPPATVGNPIEPQLFTIPGVTSNDQAKLIKFEKVRFTSTGNFANEQNYTITDGTNNYVVRSDFLNVNYINTAIPVQYLDLTGVVLQHFSTLQIVPRNLADFRTYNNDATLSVFTIGGENVLTQDGIVVTKPSDKGAFLKVDNFGTFTGLVATPNDANAQRFVMVNGDVIEETNLAALTFASGDVILVTVVAEDTKTTKLYKLTLWDVIPYITITSPPDGTAYFSLQTLTFEWETNLTGIFHVQVTFPNNMTQLVDEVDAEDGIFSVLIPNGIPTGTYKFRLIWKENPSVISNQVTFTATDNLKPYLLMTRPANGAKNIAIGQVLRMTFDEVVFAKAGNIVVKKASDNSVFATIDITGTSVEFDGTEVEITLPDMDNATEYFVLADKGIVLDVNGLEFDGITDENTWRFTTSGFYEITILVTDGTGPVENATVNLYTDPMQTLQTNAEGKAVFEDVPFGWYGLTVNKANYGWMSMTVYANEDKTIPVTLIPFGATTYEVKFEIKHKGNPFPLAQVELQGYGQRWADENGIAVFAHVLPADDIQFTVTNWDIESIEGLVTVTDANVVVPIAVTRVYQVGFIVTDGEGPVAGARVEFDGKEIITSGGGYAIFEKVREGMVKPYRVSKKGYVSFTGVADISDNWNQIRVVLEKVKVSITFNISDGTNPLQGALVDLGGVEKVTGADGKAVFTGVEYAISVPFNISKSGYQGAGGSVDATEDREVNITLHLIKYTVTFTVSHGANPVSGATVTVAGQTPLTTNASGVATIDLAPGAYTYGVTATGFVGVSGIGFTVVDAKLNIPVSLSAVNIDLPGSTGGRLLAYPNPSNGLFTLEIPSTPVKSISVEIMDITGKLVYRNDYPSEGSLRETIDLQQLTKGMYFLRISEGERVSTMKLIFR